MTPIECIDLRITRIEGQRAALGTLLDELRALRAELVDAAEPAPGAQVYRDDKEHVPPGEPHGNGPAPEAAPKPKRGRPRKVPAPGKGSAGADEPRERNRLNLLRTLNLTGPQTTDQLARSAGLSRSYASELLSGHPWFGRANRLQPWELTEAGRAALAGAST